MIFITGSGRSGTTIHLELLRTYCPDVTVHKDVEDRQLFKRDPTTLPLTYAVKLTTNWYDLADIKTFMEANPNMKVIYTQRDPRDIVISKMYRGLPRDLGGDGSNQLSADATPQGAISDMQHAWDVYTFLRETHPTRLLVVKLEDTILNTAAQIERIARFLNLKYVPFTGEVPMRDNYKRARYGTKIDKSQVGLWRRIDHIYNGYFTAPECRRQLLEALQSPLIKEGIQTFNYPDGDVGDKVISNKHPTPGDE